MAVTKTHPIKSTLKAAIDYICNPEKTDGKLLVSSYGCAAETADIEFSWTRRHAIDKGTNLGRHLIQAFQPGEVTPEQAHEIGMTIFHVFVTLFRPFLLDGITMLGLAGETELANQFSHIQKIFLNALRQESGTTIVLGEYLPIADLESAVDEYTVLIERNK